MACMRQHHAELSDECKAAIAEFRGALGKGKNGRQAQQHAAGRRHEQCIAYVQQTYRYKPKVAAKPALARCMQGESIPAGFNKEEGF